MTMVYEAAGIIGTWNGINVTEGVGDDTFLVIEPLSARKEATFGAKGEMTASKLANKGATITLTLKQTSPANIKIAAIAAAEELAGAETTFSPFIVIDPTNKSEVFFADNAMLTEIPSTEYGASVGEKTWVWVCESYITADTLSNASTTINTIKSRF